MASIFQFVSIPLPLSITGGITLHLPLLRGAEEGRVEPAVAIKGREGETAKITLLSTLHCASHPHLRLRRTE